MLTRNLIRILRSFAWVCLAMIVPAEGEGQPFSTQKADFTIIVNKFETDYKIMSVFVLPDEKLKIEIKKTATATKLELYSPDGIVIGAGSRRWVWGAPSKPGLYVLYIAAREHQRSMSLNVFVIVPFEQLKGDYLNGFRVGKYPQALSGKRSFTDPPRGFVEVTAYNEDTFVSPHFKLKQFLCKQNGDYPKYLVLREKLLLKLELILEKVNEKGYPCNTFHVMSGYRSPFYNKAIGNVKYSRHIYGGAADIFVDEDPKDNMMDDLNKDGKIDYKDANVIYRIIDELYGKKYYNPFLGGLGRYKKNETHGPFVHVDVRGRRIRWGD